MNDDRIYLVEYQVIRQVETTCIPKHGKSRSKRRQIKSQFMPFYNTICDLLEIKQKSAKQQFKWKSDEIQENRKQHQPDYKNFQVAW